MKSAYMGTAMEGSGNSGRILGSDDRRSYTPKNSTTANIGVLEYFDNDDDVLTLWQQAPISIKCDCHFKFDAPAAQLLSDFCSKLPNPSVVSQLRGH